MTRPLRYTGCYPPPEVLTTYPNWELATDEEGEPDQDETTLRPEDQQQCISDYTAASAANVTFANGKRECGVFDLMSFYVISISVFAGSDWWSLDLQNDRKTWTVYVQHWLPERERAPVVSLSDTAIFPLRIRSVLPDADGNYIEFVIPLERTGAQDQSPWLQKLGHWLGFSSRT